MNLIDTYILAGGKSTRFGTPAEDKARARLAGKPLIVHLAEQLQPFAAAITVVADVERKYADLGLHTIVDHQPGLGPLAGLERALTQHAETTSTATSIAINEYLLLLSCDLIEVRPAWVETFSAAITEANTSPARPQVIAFSDPADAAPDPNRIHPMPGLYHSSLRPLVAQRLRNAQRGFQSFIRATHHQLLPRPPDWPALTQINTTADWRSAASQTRR